MNTEHYYALLNLHAQLITAAGLPDQTRPEDVKSRLDEIQKSLMAEATKLGKQ